MACTAAQIQELHLAAQMLEAAGKGERGDIIARLAGLLGCAQKTVYAHLKKYAGWSSGKKKRCDAGKTCVDEDLAHTAAGLVHMARRQNGKKTLSIKASRETLAANGYGTVNAETGEVTMPSAETLSRAMRVHYGCHPKQLAGASPAQKLRSLHPNHTWQVDASVCVLYRLPKGEVRLLNERDYNAHKPGKLIEVSGQRIIRYVVSDHYSHNFYVHYEQARGEDALGVMKALMGAMCDRGPRDVMHGVFFQLMMDPGSGNKASLLLQFLKLLGIKALHHAAGNARATGSVESLQNIVECGFESRLRFQQIPSVADLQAQSDRWRRHFLATAKHSRHKTTRNAAWMRITDAQLRTVKREVLEAIAAWKDERRKIDNYFRISVDTRVFGKQEYDLRELGYHGLNAGDWVSVRLNPFRAPVVTVVKELPDGTELMFDVPPVEKDEAGFDVISPVIGEEFKALPETKSEQALKKVLKAAYGTDSIKDAEKAHKARNRQPFAHIDINADLTEAPLHLRRKGAGFDLDTPKAQPLPLNHAQAARRLREMCLDAFEKDATACMDMVKARHPVTVPEDKLTELAAAINDRFNRMGVIHNINTLGPAGRPVGRASEGGALAEFTSANMLRAAEAGKGGAACASA